MKMIVSERLKKQANLAYWLSPLNGLFVGGNPLFGTNLSEEFSK